MYNDAVIAFQKFGNRLIKICLVKMISVSLLLCSCDLKKQGNDSGISNTPLGKMANDLNGQSNLDEFLFDHVTRTNTLKAKLGEHGIGLDSSTRMSDKDASECDQFLPVQDRNKIHLSLLKKHRMIIYVDAAGRPAYAAKLFPAGAKGNTKSRKPYCQRKIGNLFNNKKPNSNYVGGHMIADSLGGFGGRINIVPQQSRFNNKEWKKSEHAVSKCLKRKNDVLMSTTILYNSQRGVVPEEFVLSVKVSDHNTGRVKGVLQEKFENVKGGGQNGDQKAELFQDKMAAICK